MFETDLDLDLLRTRIVARWEELSGEPMVVGSLEWAYREVLVLIASWAKIDVEKAISVAYDSYAKEIYLLPFGAANKAAVIAIARAYTDVADVNVADPVVPMVVPVYLLAKTGTPTAEQIENLRLYLNSPAVKNICDTYVVAAATRLLWNFNATISVSADPITLKTLATAAITAYAASKVRLGAIVLPSDLIALLRKIKGIEDATIASPIANILTAANQFPELGTLNITTTIV